MNLGEIRAAIQGLGYTTDTAAQQTNFINRAYQNVCGQQRWPFLEAQDTSITTSVGVPGYSIDALPWRQLDAVRIEITANQQFDNLHYLEPQAFRDYEHIDRDTSTPWYWTWMNGKLRFYPYPDNTYKVTIDYVLAAPDLVSDSDVPLLPTPYHDILVWGPVMRLAYRERDWLGRQFAQQEYELQLKRMQEEYLVRQRQTSSHVKKSGYWDTQVPYPFTRDGA